MQRIYLDNNSTTRPAPEVVEAMAPWMGERHANPSSPHPDGEASADAIRAARGRVASLLGCLPSEVCFTSGASESIATAFASALATAPEGRRKLIVSSVEHSAVKYSAQRAEDEGWNRVVIGVDEEGRLDRELLLSEIDSSCAFVSLILANNETGVLSNLQGVGEACRAAGASLHVDAVQVPGKVVLDVGSLGCDFLSLSAHKFHGPAGVGVLFLRSGQTFRPLIVGGPQEDERRAGTENVAAIVGLGVAAQLAQTRSLDTESLAAMENLRDTLEQRLLASLPDSRANGAGSPRVPNTLNVYLGGLEAAYVLAVVGQEGVDASAGSACNATSTAPSPVLMAMGRDEAQASGSLRFSLSAHTTAQEIDRAGDVVIAAVQALRSL
ncbi:MAG: cysteine desulfurase family protein [Planctomycetota bacterium]|jgi:cysteine desulfurase|nr:cysteine desulfurase family protein [Planctomycetota bacterium]